MPVNEKVNEKVNKQKKPNIFDAYRAVRLLVKDNEKTEQVFIILEALGQRASKREWRRFQKSPMAARILAEPHLIDLLCDRDYLSGLPAGTLGRSYYEFTKNENISPAGLVEASEDGWSPRTEFSLEQEKIYLRQRDAHDLWHVVTGYGRDRLGELCLLGVSYKMIDNPGFLLIILFGFLESRKTYAGVSILSALWEAFRHGGQMVWLPGIDWRGAMAQPLDELRTQWGVKVPETYHTTREKLTALDIDYMRQAAE